VPLRQHEPTHPMRGVQIRRSADHTKTDGWLCEALVDRIVAFASYRTDEVRRRQPHGLTLYFRETLGIGADGVNVSPWADDYVRLLRGYVDLWLATGRRKGVDTPASRRPVPEISQIVERVVTANRVLPTALKDGYSLAVVAVQPSLRRSRAVQDASIATRSAERCFVDMLMSEWRLKIAKCPDASCGIYFRLGRWNQPYDKGTLCPNCKQTQQQDAIQKRVEARRLRAKQAIYAFVATRFARHIAPGRAWYRDVSLKARIANALNTHFRSDPLFRTLYPRGITGKWVEAGRSRTKNWLCIERARRGRSFI
jgi:hypothetical protein